MFLSDYVIHWVECTVSSPSRPYVWVQEHENYSCNLVTGSSSLLVYNLPLVLSVHQVTFPSNQIASLIDPWSDPSVFPVRHWRNLSPTTLNP